jgi:EAL and modified HD-GYP domain-containing signal transduction protein
MGLLSMVDAILEIPMVRVVGAIPVDHQTKAVLLGAASQLRPLYEFMLARESGDWTAGAQLSKQLALSESEVAEAYWQAMQWARQLSAAG